MALTAGAGTAAAATVTIGNPLTGAGYADLTWGSSVTQVNLVLIDGRVSTSPVDGTVVSWGVGDPQGSFALLVLHPQPGGAYAVAAGTSPQPLNFPFGGSPPHPASLPIKANDLIALSQGPGSSHVFTDQANGVDAWVQPALGLGQTTQLAAPPYNISASDNVAFNATVRYCVVPKLAKLKLGSAKSALSAANCALGKVTKPKLKSAKKAKKRKPKLVVSSQGAPAGTNLADTVPIDLTVVKK
jgi:hypothetical protein